VTSKLLQREQDFDYIIPILKIMGACPCLYILMR
jgi:hypothetical protein